MCLYPATVCHVSLSGYGMSCVSVSVSIHVHIVSAQLWYMYMHIAVRVSGNLMMGHNFISITFLHYLLQHLTISYHC